MSLVDKLEGVHRGDLIVLRTDTGLEVGGYLQDYSSKKVKLSTTNPRNNVGGTGFLQWMHIGRLDNTKTYKLKYFDNYKVLKEHISE